MLWYCKFKWHPKTTAEALRRRILEQDEAATNHPERVRGSEPPATPAGRARAPRHYERRRSPTIIYCARARHDERNSP
jgi:hypothetical protein